MSEAICKTRLIEHLKICEEDSLSQLTEFDMGMAKAFKKMRELIESGRFDFRESETRWISVNDRLPDHNCKVLVVDVRGDKEIVLYENGRLHVDGEVTHWMPIPASPHKK